MKFTLSTKPLTTAVNLGIIKENISKFNQKSGIVQITANANTLRLNIEAPRICTEMVLQGSGDFSEEVTTYVDCVLFKSLIDSFDADITSIEFVEGSVVLRSGSGKFSLSTIANPGSGEGLQRPEEPDNDAESIAFDSDAWSFVKSRQMFAISIWMIQPVYTRVYVNSDGSVIVGDMINSLFTLSHKSNFPNTMLLKPSIINLFNILPEGTVITPHDSSYIIDVVTDSYSVRTQFTPEYESDDGVGSYSSDIIMPSLQPKDSYIEIPIAPVLKFIGQSEILLSGADNLSTFELTGDTITISSDNSKFTLQVPKIGEVPDFSGVFKSTFFKSIFASVDGDVVKVSPIYVEGEDGVNSCLFWTDNMSIVIGQCD